MNIPPEKEISSNERDAIVLVLLNHFNGNSLSLDSDIAAIEARYVADKILNALKSLGKDSDP